MKKRPLHKKIRDHLFFLLLQLIIMMLRLMPRRMAIGFMKSTGRLIFRLAGSERTRTIRQLTMALGKEKTASEIEAIACRVFMHFAAISVDFVRLPDIIRQGINNLIDTQGMEHLDKAMAEGKGVIMITGHFGNWELLGAWLAQNGYPLKVVGTSLDDPRLDALVVRNRNAAGYTNIARGKGTREIIRTLRQGHVIGMLIDQDTEVQSLFVNFFGRPAYTPTGAAVLARKLNVPIIPIFMPMNEDLTYSIECGAPLDLQQTENEEEDILTNTQRCTDVIEEMIRRSPSQWVWMHKRWHKQPADNSDGYVLKEI